MNNLPIRRSLNQSFELENLKDKLKKIEDNNDKNKDKENRWIYYDERVDDIEKETSKWLDALNKSLEYLRDKFNETSEKTLTTYEVCEILGIESKKIAKYVVDS